MMDPPRYESVVEHDLPTYRSVVRGGLTFKDFLPACLESEGFFSKPVYESFRALVDRANQWLSVNPQWEIKTCESVEFKTRGEFINYEKMTYLEYGEAGIRYIRGLRIWLIERTRFDRGQQIGYLNLVPEPVDQGGMFNSATFETLQNVLQRFNYMIRTKPIPGRIITVETQEMKLKYDLEIDPDRSSWTERGEHAKRFIFVIRVFYEITDPIHEEIGAADFLPDKVRDEGFFSHPRFEPFSNIVQKVSYWSAQQSGIRICNVQSIEIKLKTGYEADTERMSYTEHGGRSTFYIRILRVAYIKLPVPQLSVRHIMCKTIVPVQLESRVLSADVFESLTETRKRVSAWVKATGADVISAETTALRINTGGELKYGTEASYTYNIRNVNEFWIFVIRLYLNGFYEEPPEEMLPPVPDMIDQDCCNIL